MTLAPIVLFVYNRPDHTLKTLEALSKNHLASESHLYIFSDGPKYDRDVTLVHKVRTIAQAITGFKKVILFEEPINKGLASSVIDGVSKIFTDYDKAIVLEDDILTSQNFLSYMNKALDFYSDKEDIFSISAYRFPFKMPKGFSEDVFISPRPSSWGWATWKNRWNKADWDVKDYQAFSEDPIQQNLFNKGGVDLSRMLQRQMTGQINSWAIRWCYAHFKYRAYSIYPVNSFVMNFGNDKSGVHSPATNKYHVDLTSHAKEPTLRYPLIENESILKRFRMFFKVNWKDRFEYLFNVLFRKS